jgi:hypothetical protein
MSLLKVYDFEAMSLQQKFLRGEMDATEVAHLEDICWCHGQQLANIAHTDVFLQLLRTELRLRSEIEQSSRDREPL